MNTLTIPALSAAEAALLVTTAIRNGTSRDLAREAREAVVYHPRSHARAQWGRAVWTALRHSPIRSSVLDEIELSIW